VLSGLIYSFARFVGMTLRLHVVNYSAAEALQVGKIYCGWHGQSLIPANFLRNKGVWVIISHSRDGEMQKRIFTKFGFQIIRGSTGRGGARALIESIRVLKKNGAMAITPDGPRGPSGVVQEGVLMMAQKSGAALIPVATYARPAWFAPTWDRYMIPCPLAKAIFIFGKPMFVPPDADDATVEETRLTLQNEIDRLQAEAKEWVSGKDVRLG
jgi:lysophospholipid acyltransferase (LPLAT)-like uncharacterized protein